MELRQLRYFTTVAEELHFGRAAERLHIVQPEVSEEVRALADEPGARLLDRSERSVSLTDAGAGLLTERDLCCTTPRAVRLAAQHANGRAHGEADAGHDAAARDHRSAERSASDPRSQGERARRRDPDRLADGVRHEDAERDR